MKPTRRTLLILTAAGLAAVNMLYGVWYNGRSTNDVRVTYVGFDSIYVVVPVKEQGAVLHGQEWRPTLKASEKSAGDMIGMQHLIPLISLGSHSDYGQFILSVRDLKARGVCHVLIRDGAEPMRQGIDVMVPTLILCGRAIGDAGFYGTLPADRTIRLD